MELNQAQLLVHDDDVMERFRASHGIPVDVYIHRPRPNEVAPLVEGNEDRISVHIWLIHQARLRFTISPMLKAMMARYRLPFMQVSVNFVRTVLVVDTLMRLLDKPFSVKYLLHVYIVVRLKKELGFIRVIIICACRILTSLRWGWSSATRTKICSLMNLSSFGCLGVLGWGW